MRRHFDHDGDVAALDLLQCIEDDVPFELIVNEGADGQLKPALIPSRFGDKSSRLS